MPWKMIYEEAPKDESLRVWQESELLELGAKLRDIRSFRDYRTAETPGIIEWQHWYECRYCKGWIEGHPNAFNVNTMDSRSLSGRNGVEYHCIRCGQQIAFVGMMS